MAIRAIALVALLTACTATPGAACTGMGECGGGYVCASTSSPTLRRCMLPCPLTWDGGVSLGELCSDGSVCRDSDRGPVCYFTGSIGSGEPCPMAGCDPMATVCDCEPGTTCHEGFCRQVCDLPPVPPRLPDAPAGFDTPPGDAGRDAGSREDHVCGPLAACTGGVCIPLPSPDGG